MTTLRGIGVTSGIAVAPVFALGDVAALSRQPGTAKEEEAAFQDALERAASALEALAAGLEEDAAEILEFQIALIEDDDLIGPIRADIAGGAAADRAWRTAMEREIADYAEGGDEVFQARAGDLADLRDRVLRCLAGKGASDLPDEPCILLAQDVAPSRFLELDRRLVKGLALGAGSRTSHVSLLARARGIPTVVGLGDLPQAAAGTTGILDADAGTLALAPSEGELQAARDLAEAAKADDRRAREMARQAAQTAPGEAVTVLVNIDHPSILEELDPAICEGVGLTRTEFLFEEGAPDEEGQLEAYRKLIDWAAGRPVTIRTLDAGGDKPLAGITLDGETNPFLGVRGLRLSLMRPELLKLQLRALLRCDSAWAGEGDAADGDGPGRDRRGPRHDGFGRGRARAREPRPCRSAARHHGRDTGNGNGRRAVRCGLLLHRHQRPDPVRHRLRAGQRGRRAPGP